jgi:transcriptional regulator with XRE-family HTH domain
MYTIAGRFLYLRSLSGLTQHEFAGSIQLSQGRLSDIEKGKNNPSTDTIISVLKNYPIQAEWLLLGKGNPPVALAAAHHQPALEPGQPLKFPPTADEELLLDTFARLSRKDQEHILSYLRFLRTQDNFPAQD